MGRQGETYGEDPTLASALGQLIPEESKRTKQQGEKRRALPHFLAFHNSNGGILWSSQRYTAETSGRNIWEAISGMYP